MKKILFFLVLTFSLFSQGNTDIVKLFEEKKYKEIINVYEQDGFNQEEFNNILAKATSDKNIEALKVLKNIPNFEEDFINYLLYLDNVELLNYYQKNNFLQTDTFSFEKLSFNSLDWDSVNILKEITKNKKDLNISKDGETLLQQAYSLASLEAFTLILEKIDKLENLNIFDDYYYYYTNKADYVKKLDALLKFNEKKKSLNNQTIESIFYFYLENKELYKAIDLLEKYKDIKVSKESKVILLTLAGIKKDYKLVEKLIKEKANIFIYNYSYDLTATDFILDNKIEKILVDNHVNTDNILAVVLFTLIKENRLNDVEKLLKSTYKIIDRDFVGKEAITSATIYGNIESLKLLKKYDLLRIGSDFDVLDYILAENQVEVYEYLLNNIEDKKFLNKIDTLVSYTSVDLLDILIENEKIPANKKEIKHKVFCFSTIKNNYKVMEHLLNKGFNINEKNQYGVTPLYYAIMNHFDNYDYCNDEILQTIKFLKEKGADFNTVDNKKSALILAVENSLEDYETNTSLVEYLLELNVDINYKDEKGYTAYDHVKQLNYKELDKIFKKYQK